MNIEQWNKRFSELNNVPINTKLTPPAYKSYLMQIMRDKPSHYKNPDDYPISIAPVMPSPSSPSVAPIATGSPLQDALKSAQATVKAIEDLMTGGI